eukprot:scaffold31614_cov80-Skeletonema_marinoi.AAC.1
MIIVIDTVLSASHHPSHPFPPSTVHQHYDAVKDTVEYDEYNDDASVSAPFFMHPYSASIFTSQPPPGEIGWRQYNPQQKMSPSENQQSSASQTRTSRTRHT